ncbi:coiled-coil domain-containing protein [Labilibacter marinus]|uniref:hypothetical protein n=1 Tax=Labilibacter marinus TaxID=1477105 RepID=UPI00082F18DC|nr:hypothetical protein [Labilibacter marinus]
MKLTILLVSSIILLNGCIVSKKKYEACLADKAKLSKKLSAANKENKALNSRIETNISDFEKMKNELHLSNAVKSDEMSDLLVKVTQLSDDNTALENKLNETIKLYKSSKQSSASATEELKNLRTDNIKLKRDTASIKYALSLSKERFTQLEGELETQKSKYNKLSADKTKLSKAADINKQKLASFEQQLVRNKEKMETISSSLIELRKEMLSAKSTKKVIDPNKNKHIDKMARELGHY